MAKKIGKMKKLLGLVLCLVMLVSAIYVPVSFSASAEATTTTFTFDTWVSQIVNNTATATKPGYWGAGWSSGGDTNKYALASGIGVDNPTYSHNRKAGYRIEKDGQVYNLEPSTTYYLTMKVMAKTMPNANSSIAAGLPCVVKLGYDAIYNPDLSGNASSKVNTMNQVIATVATGQTGSNICTLYTISGEKEVNYADGVWHEVQISFTTPANMDGMDRALALWCESFSNFQIGFDDVTIIKLDAGESLVVAYDEYSDTKDVIYGTVGAAVSLPDISDRALNADHTFKGWYLDTDRTQKAENLVFTQGAQVVYSSWEAPVTYTFMDTLNNQPHTVEGKPGDTFEYPADPTDPSNQKWFMGWYTSEECTEEFTENTFGNSNKTIYSLWKGEIPGNSLDFTTYNFATNIEVFGRLLSLQNTAGIGVNDDYALLLDYAGDKVYKYNCSACTSKFNTEELFNNHNTSSHSGAATYAISYFKDRYNQLDHSFTVANNLEDNTAYKITYKYKVVDANVDTTVNVASCHPSNIWDSPNRVLYTAKNSISKDSTGWQTDSLVITTNYAGTGNAVVLYLTFSSNDINGKANILFDDIEIEAVVQPYESAVNLIKNNGEADEILKGTRGDVVALPNITNASGAEFKGWYLDEAFTQRVENVTLSRNPVTVYAKWGGLPITFETYDFPTRIEIFGRLLSLQNTAGIGVNDDYALLLDYAGDKVYKYNCSACTSRFNTEELFNNHNTSSHSGAATYTLAYFKDRYNQLDHSFPVAKNVSNNTVYKITYKYKVVDANTDAVVHVATTNPSNMWDTPNRQLYSATADISKDSTEWKTGTIVVKTDLKGTGNTIALYVTFADGSMDAKAQILFDDVLVESISADVLVFDSTLGHDAVVIDGNAGDTFTAPTFDTTKQFLGWYLDKEYTTPFTATTMPEGIVNVYAKWKVGIIRFNTNKAGISVPDIEGNPGEAITLPTLVDEEDKFVGWYTDSAFTTPFNQTTLPEGVTQLYAKWRDGVITFKNYKLPTNVEIFGRLMSIQNVAGIGVDDDYALRFNYAGDMVYKYVCSASDCGKKYNTLALFESHKTTDHAGEANYTITYFNTRASEADHSFPIAKNVDNNTLYKITYSYKVVNSNLDATVHVATTNPTNMWDTPTRTIYPATNIISKDSTGWNTNTMIVTTDLKGTGNTITLYVTLENKNMDGKAEILFDNIIVEPITGDVLVFDSTIGFDYVVIQGNVGDPFTAPTFNTNREFLGWYLDKEYTTPFTATTMPEGVTMVYGKWAPGPITFENYRLPTNVEIFGRLMSIQNVAGIGVDDDYALRFNYAGDMVYKYVCSASDCGKKYNTLAEFEAHNTGSHADAATYTITYFNTRASEADHSFPIAKEVINNTVYKITYKYKVVNANVDATVHVATTNPTNMWDAPKRTIYPATNIISKDSTGWNTNTMIINTDLKDGGNTITLYVTLENKNIDGKAEILFDDVMVEAITGNALVFDSTLGHDYVVIQGNVGDPFTAPTFNTNREFLGWYLDKEYTTPFTATTIPAGVTMVYGKWAAAPMTFETYNFPKNAEIFGRLMKIDKAAGLGIDDDYVLRFSYRGDMVYKYDCAVEKCGKRFNTLADFEAHKASVHGGAAEYTVAYYNTRTSTQDHAFPIAKEVMNNTVYKITYSYKVVASDADVTVNIVSTNPSNIWDTPNRTSYDITNTIYKDDTEWKTQTMYIATDLKGNGNTLAFYLTFTNTAIDAQVDILFDNLMVEAITGNAIIFNSTQGHDVVIIEGNPGDPFTAPVFAGRSEFLGWYLDKEYTTPFTATTIPKGVIMVYGKWAPGPMTFERYDFPRNPEIFGRLMSIEKGAGVGIDDDYALRFNYAGDKVYKYKCACSKMFNDEASFNAHNKASHSGASSYTILYYNTRTSQQDHIFPIAKNIADKTLYKVTFNYKMVDSNVMVTVYPATCNPTSIWQATDRTIYSSSSAVLPKTDSGQGWKEASFCFSSDIKGIGTTLALYCTLGGAQLTDKADVLFDNIIVEPVEAPYVFFDFQNGEDFALLRGKAGEKIEAPEAFKFGCTFIGWFMDKECTEPFTLTEFAADTAITAYAGYKDNPSRTYDFEKYDIPYYTDIGKAKLQLVLIHHVKSDSAASGEYVMEIDRMSNPELTHAANMVLAYGKDIYHVEREAQYIVEFKYRVSVPSTSPLTIWFATSSPDNYYDSNKKVSTNVTIKSDTKQGVWYTAITLVDTSATIEGKEALMLCSSGGDGKVQIDDVKITYIPEGTTGIVVNTNGCKTIPNIIYGKEGENYASKLPKNPTFEGKTFGGYFLENVDGGLTELKEEDMKFSSKFTRVYAMFLDNTISQDFEVDFKSYVDKYKAYTIFDFDYELYDSKKEGNSADNVVSGRYSLHRKGESRYFENSVILTNGHPISSYHKYTITMKVKLGKHFHTDGAIKVVSNRSATYAWSPTADYYVVSPIKDLKEGEWVEISCTFQSAEPYVSLQTPGYVELFIDDIVFTLEPETKVLSTAPEYTEYVPLRRDASGNIIDFSIEQADVDSIIDSRLKLKSGNSVLTVIIISVAAAVIVAAAVVLILFLAKRKKAKAKI